MRTFYDFRADDRYEDPKKYPLQGYVLLKSKYYWLCWIYRDGNVVGMGQSIKGFIVAPRTIYLYNVYLATGFWDALKQFIKIVKKKK
jgi:hypothetical protein